MDLGQKLKAKLESILQKNQDDEKEIVILLKEIDNLVENSYVVKCFKHLSECYDLGQYIKEKISTKIELNNVQCFVKFYHYPCISLNVENKFNLIYYPTDSPLRISVFDNKQMTVPFFIYQHGSVMNVINKYQKLEQHNRDIAKENILMLLSSIKDDKILDIATETLISKISTNSE
nr:MAG TPA: hypothetical protein [Crassvirales sp.]